MAKSVPAAQPTVARDGAAGGGGAGGSFTNALPIPVDSSTIHFTDIHHGRVTVRWEAAGKGLYQWQVLGYQVAWRQQDAAWPSDAAPLSPPSPNQLSQQNGMLAVMTLAGSPGTGSDTPEVVVPVKHGVGLYFFRIRAWNHAGRCEWSDSSYGYWPPGERERKPLDRDNLLVSVLLACGARV